MKHYFFIVSVLLFFFLPAYAFAEQVDSFSADIHLANDSSFTVTETIVYDFGSEYRHGIFRYIEKQHPQKASVFFKERSIDIMLADITQDGKQVPYEVEDTLDRLSVKIGNPDAVLSGVHTYAITYTVQGGFSYFNDGSELYWNVTGNGWEVPLQIVQANIFAPDPSFLVQEHACYKGFEGENDSCTITQGDDGSVSFVATGLSSGEGLTIAQAVDQTQIEKVIIERVNGAIVLAILLPVALLSAIIFGYRRRTAYKTHNTIIAEYEPYQGTKPMYAGMLLDGRLDPRDITAGIVYLAQQGFIKIKKTERKAFFLFEVADYEIITQRQLTEIATPFLMEIAQLLFMPDAPVGTAVSLSTLKSDTSKQRANNVTLQYLRSALKKDMQQEGYIEVNNKILFWIILGGCILFASLFLFDMFTALLGWVWYCAFSLALGGFVYTLFVYERRTQKGYEAIDQLKGFKLFLSVTDKERFAFHNAPQKSPEQFMEYLPYAIAFGVEKQWAQAFSDITMPNPDWYDGGSVAAFSASDLTTSLGAFSSSFATSSGSSGSGSSGGGGGGGGGGSW